MSEEEINKLNIAIIKSAMESLYHTHIVDQPISTKRGEAIQAMEAMILLLGGTSGVAECEAVPHSKRMRESGYWGDDEAI